ncbi:hypothetical protein ABZ896_22805 [Streptomyces sp. NPDC047072]|uniref:hypothetical protein n=1 Tax=Streptomyces sp. NPDC047072 TaxID=3154809 RepID=UPI003409B00D
MHATLHPEHTIHAYRQERPSLTRLIREAQWAYYQLTYALEHQPDTDAILILRRHQALHLGALCDVLALRTGDPNLHEAARDHGDMLREVDSMSLHDHPRNGRDHLRTQYGHLHGHARGAAHATPLPALSPLRRLPLQRTGPWLVHHMCDHYAWALLGQSPQFPGIDVPHEQRRHLITQGVILDWAASASPTDTATTTAAARAGHALRALDSQPALDDQGARAYLLDIALELDDQDHQDDDPHPLDCAGGCAGDGEILTVLTWEHHGEGIYTPVHQEPILCLGTATSHAADCPTCEGHGYTYRSGYRELCLDGRTAEVTHQDG